VGFHLSHVLRQGLSVDGHLHQILGMISDALLAQGPIHDNHVGVFHDVDDDADCLAINLTHIIADFETAAQQKTVARGHDIHLDEEAPATTSDRGHLVARFNQFERS
jgi:hypothetical protein